MNTRKKYLIIGLFGIIFTFFGGTLAYYQWESGENSKTLVTFTVENNFKCAADGGGNITGSDVMLAPSTCTNEKYAIKREITVKPTITGDNVVISMDLWLDIEDIGTGLSNSQNFMYALTSVENSCTQGVIKSGNFNNKKKDDMIKLLNSKAYSSTTTETYYLYIWLDEAETSIETANQTFSLSLNGSCTNDPDAGADLKYNITNLSNNSNTLDDGFYTLSNYTCNNNTILTYNSKSNRITSNGIDKCDLEFTKIQNPKLYDIVEIGDYISYIGNNGCDGIHCSGFNANQLESETGELDTYGYCNDEDYKFYTYGWRVLYKGDNSVYIVSAGAPECTNVVEGDPSATLENINNLTLKYCNNKYLSGGTCEYSTAHPFNNEDFYKFTSQYYGSNKAMYIYKDSENPYCVDYNVPQSIYCGYSNDIIDNGENYLYGTIAYIEENAATEIFYFEPYAQRIYDEYGYYDLYGIRPVLKLDSTIYIISGRGTINNPYIISERIQ